MSTEFVNKISRRNLIKGFSFGIVGLVSGFFSFRRLFQSEKYSFSGGIVGANAQAGHRLREGLAINSTQGIPAQVKTIDTLIVGGGISGLSAAWWLRKNKFEDFLLFEMDSEVGGNSAHGGNSISQYPWGAHYVPLPGPEAHYVREFFQEIGVIRGYAKGLPIYDEYFLCADFHERLFFQGEWQEGMVPQHGIQKEDKRQYDEFFSFVEELKHKKGSDQKAIFCIPVDSSSQDPEFLQLDKVSMAQFMNSRGWTSRYLNWYVNYCCRDDYGMPQSQVSAWVGLHYFASRAGVAANADAQAVLTWPEGNGFLVSQLKARVGEQIRQNSLVYSIDCSEGENRVDVLDVAKNARIRYIAKNIIYAGPRFTAKNVINGYQDKVSLNYAPWVVANISLKQRPQGPGTPLAWDNVSFYSKSLGYIVANHQDLKFNQNETVITYYLPLDERSPLEERKAAQHRSYQDWLDIIVPDLEKVHPGISQTIFSLDIWVWGHGMVSPGIDYVWSKQREEMLKPFGAIEFAHSDMSGISVFEEAQFRGVEAAKKVLKKVRA